MNRLIVTATVAAALTASLLVATDALADSDKHRRQDRQHWNERNDRGHRDNRHDRDRREDRRHDARHHRDRDDGRWDDKRWDDKRRHTHRHVERHVHYYDHRHHGRYRVVRYVPPRGYYYRSWHRGARLPAAYYAPRYVIHDYHAYRLRPPPYGYHWVRVDNDVVLAAITTGVVMSVVNGIFFAN